MFDNIHSWRIINTRNHIGSVNKKVWEIKMKPEYGTCNISEMTASELILELRTAEFATNRTIELKDNAFDYDVEGFAESIQDDDRLFDFDFDGSRIVCNGQTFCTFRLVSE